MSATRESAKFGSAEQIAALLAWLQRSRECTPLHQLEVLTADHARVLPSGTHLPARTTRSAAELLRVGPVELRRMFVYVVYGGALRAAQGAGFAGVCIERRNMISRSDACAMPLRLSSSTSVSSEPTPARAACVRDC